MGLVAITYAAIGGLVIGLIVAAIITSALNEGSKTGSFLTFLFTASFTVPGSAIAIFVIFFWWFSGRPSIFGGASIPPPAEATEEPGPFLRSYDNGAREEGFKDEYGWPTGTVFGWYPGGQKAYERVHKRTYDIYGPGVTWREHEWREWYESGRLKGERVLVDESSSIYRVTWWYENGQKFIEGNYSKDVAVGVQKHWSEAGALLCEWTETEKGHLTSLNTWYEDGRPQYRSGPNYKNNRRGTGNLTVCNPIPKGTHIRL